MTCARLIRLWLLAIAASSITPAASAEVVIDWVTVGDPGNACDTQTEGCFGAVAVEYRISKFEVSNAQYTELLNAVAATDTNALYNTNMGSGFGGITQSGSSGSYAYSTIAGREDLPVNYVSFWDATRFANWLHNGQPTGAQDSTTTEDGAYTLTPAGIAANSVTRNGGATVFVTSEDEWYKAAYYKGGGTSAGYWDYPAGSDTVTTCSVPGATANTANCEFVILDLTAGGSYTGSASPSGTFDQGGNVWEWNEAIFFSLGRGLRGGVFDDTRLALAASLQDSSQATNEPLLFGFRIATGEADGDGVPEAEEDAGPNGGDANGDGILDSTQPDVASLRAGAGPGYVTVEVSGDCGTLLDVDTTTEADAPAADPSFDYPYGLVEFRLPCASAMVRIFFHGATSPLPLYRKYGPTTPGDSLTAAWYSLPGATFGTAVVGGATVQTVTLSLVDGALGDATVVDGMIVDPGGVAADISEPEPIPALGPLGIAILLGALGATAYWMLRDSGSVS